MILGKFQSFPPCFDDFEILWHRKGMLEVVYFRERERVVERESLESFHGGFLF